MGDPLQQLGDFKSKIAAFTGPVDPRDDVLAGIGTTLTVASLISVIALLVIGGMATHGTVGGSTAGWTLCGISGAFLLGNVLTSRATWQQKGLKGILNIALENIFFLTWIIVGILGGVGALSGFTVGWVICGTAIAIVGVPVLLSSCCSPVASSLGVALTSNNQGY